MTRFGECALLVLERIGLGGDVPESYLLDLEKLNEAAAAWQRQPDALRLGFLEFDLPDLLGGEQIVTGNLPEAISLGWAKNDAAKAFVRFIDARSGRRATLLQLQIILVLQEAMQTKNVNAAGGEA